MSQATNRTPRKAVIPAAGLGTRFLPATKAVPKELLPVVDTPAMQYIVEEAVDAGLPEVLVVTGRGKEAIADHFDRAPELEAALEQKGDKSRLDAVRRSADLADVHYIRQGSPLGLGHAVLCAAPFVGDEPFAVMLGDDLIDARDPLLKQMLAIRAERGVSVVALLDVTQDQTRLYGVVVAQPTDAEDVVRITDLVEKPDRDAVASCSSPMHCRRWPSRGSRCTAWFSAAGGTTPVTGWTTCVRWCSSRTNIPIWAMSSGHGCRASWTRDGERGRRVAAGRGAARPGAVPDHRAGPERTGAAGCAGPAVRGGCACRGAAARLRQLRDGRVRGARGRCGRRHRGVPGGAARGG